MFTILNPVRVKHQRVWFTSDCHFNHDKDFIYQKRFGLNSRTEYDEYLINLWNSVVAPEDVVFDLGDFVLSDGQGVKAFSILPRLNGEHYLLWGNHNSGVKLVFKDQVHYPFTLYDKVHIVGHYLEAVVQKQPIVMCHYPMLSWNDAVHGTWMLHGHCHGTFNDEQFGKIQDVGLDVFKTLVSFEQLKDIMDKRQIQSWDQHDEATSPSRKW